MSIINILILFLLPLCTFAGDLKESDYAKAHCKGTLEYRLFDGTRVDCLADDRAIEFDFCHKWAEAAGQARWYSAATGKPPGVVLICSPDEDRFIYRAMVACGVGCLVETVPK